jgi:bifunctional DNase/RNase
MERTSGRRVCLFVLAAILTACSCTGRHRNPPDPSAEVGPGEVKVRVAAVRFDEFTQAHYVVLSSEDRQRELPILIGDGEADAIMRALHGVKPERPLTHELMKSIIEGTGNHVDCVAISDLRDEVFYAIIYMNGGKIRIDSRPSDAIALAASVGAPIFVASRLFEEGGAPGVRARYSPATVTVMGITVQELTPPLAQYFRAGKGVLVADVTPDAEKNGIERGDIITQVGSHPVATLEDFRRLAMAEAGRTVMLRVSHDGAEHNVAFSR